MKMGVDKWRRNKPTTSIYFGCTTRSQSRFNRDNAVTNDANINVRTTIGKIGVPENEIHGGEVSFLESATQGGTRRG
jgi:hypothetical protein